MPAAWQIEKQHKGFLDRDMPCTKWVGAEDTAGSGMKRRYRMAFLGSVDTEELSRRIREGRLLRLSQPYDTFGRVMSRRWASGVPVGLPGPGPLDVVTVQRCRSGRTRI